MYFTKQEPSPDLIIDLPITTSGEEKDNVPNAAAREDAENQTAALEPTQPKQLKVTIEDTEILSSDSESSIEG